MFITFEGIDGTGKTGQTRRMREYLVSRGYDVVLTREPGGTLGAEEIRGLLLKGDTDRWSAMTEILLFNAARRDHVERVIHPALEQGKIVICDRYVGSTKVYQAMKDPELAAKVDLLHREMIGLDPDLTILLDVDPETGLKRATGREVKAVGNSTTPEQIKAIAELRMESRGIGFLTQARELFLAFASHDPRTALVPTDGANEDQVFEKCRSVIERMLERNPDPSP